MKHRTAKELLIRFLKRKAQLIAKYSEVSYILESDYSEIIQYSQETCEKILSTMIENYFEKAFTDSLTCPWCLQHPKCLKCKYGLRHGFCLNRTSDYSKIINDLGRKKILAIVSIPRFRKHFDKYIKIFKKFLENI
jgi:hypothetical protein